MNDQGPGAVINPGGEQPPQQPSADTVPAPQAEPAADFYAPEEQPAVSPYSPSPETATPQQTFDDQAVVAWTASEFIDHQKGFSWFLILGFIAVVVGGVIYFLTRELFGPVIVVVLAIIFGIGAARKPRELHYAITASGVEIENKVYPYSELKHFSLITVGSVPSIVLMPTKRWQPSISLFVDPANVDHIVDSLATFLPIEEHSVGVADRFLNKIRF